MAEPKTTKAGKTHTKTKVRKPWQSGQYTVYLWEFLYGLLQDPECCSLIMWTNKDIKEFKINNAHEIAHLWGTVKNRPTMDDKKLLRALRYYYKTKILRKVKGHKGVYQFLSIPYETEICDEEMNTPTAKASSSPPGSSKSGFTDFSVKTENCSDRLKNYCGKMQEHCGTTRNISENNRHMSKYHLKMPGGDRQMTNTERQISEMNERMPHDARAMPQIDRNIREQDRNILPNHHLEQAEFFDEYRSRAVSSSESSTSSDSSTAQSLDEMQAELLNSGVLDNMNITETMDFVVGGENTVCQNNNDTLHW